MMARVLVATVAFEGGFYSQHKDPSAPIRIYSDCWIEDDIAAAFTGSVKRNRLSRKDIRWVRRVAKVNAMEGRV